MWRILIVYFALCANGCTTIKIISDKAVKIEHGIGIVNITVPDETRLELRGIGAMQIQELWSIGIFSSKVYVFENNNQCLYIEQK